MGTPFMNLSRVPRIARVGTPGVLASISTSMSERNRLGKRSGKQGKFRFQKPSRKTRALLLPLHNRDRHRDKTGTLPHDDGTRHLLHWLQIHRTAGRPSLPSLSHFRKKGNNHGLTEHFRHPSQDQGNGLGPHRCSVGNRYLVGVLLASRTWILARGAHWICHGASSRARGLWTCSRPHFQRSLCRGTDR
jgi:hypothetical protein